ncbi:MAG: patatin-like phospholipase family protein [Candidatus Pacebacteria bacterium]|nr:patatin-like phospholipase family protein [Candidatus Paceibacterota bacterium]
MFAKDKIGLALSGGSALGISHIGVLKALEENKIKIDYIAGTSSGSIIAAAFAFGLSFEQMTDVSKKINWINISNFAYSKLGLASNKPLGKLIKEIFGDVKIEDAKIPLAIVATDIEKGQKVVLQKGNLAEALMASSCLPGIYVPIIINEQKLIDGGWSENLPLSVLKKMGADMIIGVNLKKYSLRKVSNVFDVLLNSLAITSSDHHHLKIQEQGADIIIEPNLMNFGYSDFNKTDKLIEAGYQATLSLMPEIKKITENKYKNKKIFFSLPRLVKKIKLYFTK